MDKNHDPYAAAAARALLSEREDKKPGLDELLDHMRVAHGLACPECRSTAVSDNGLSGAGLIYRCDDCAHEWLPERDA